MKEIWKDIIGYEGMYQISNMGRVKSLKRKRVTNDRILKLKQKRNGYWFVCLCKESNEKYFHVHRLVSLAFIDNPENKPTVNHKDCNKQNNNVDNLEWTTYKENIVHAKKNIEFKYNYTSGFDHYKTNQILQLDNNKNYLYVWKSAKEISNYYNISESAILSATIKKTISIGYYWEKITKDEYYRLKWINKKIPSMIVDKKYRDTTKAHEARRSKSNSISNDSLIKNGVNCILQYGNINRNNFEEYARNNKCKGYSFVVKRFGTYKEFQNICLNKHNNQYYETSERISN